MILQNEELCYLKMQLSEKEGQLKEKVEEHARLLKMMEKWKEEKEERTSVPLTGVGKRCLGEKHQDTIQSQAVAISELRRKIHDLVSANPPGKRERESG